MNSAGNVVPAKGSTLKPGYYTMKVSSPGYTTQTFGAPTGTTAPVKVGGGGTPVTATLTQTPVTFRVGINTASGALLTCPAANPHCVTVSLRRIDTSQAALTSNTQDSGHYFDFRGIDPASYVITVTGAGLQTTSTQYTVPLGTAGQQPAPFRMTVSPVPAVTAPTAPASAGGASRKVSVAVTTTADGDDVAGAVVQLSAAGSAGTLLTPNPAIAAGRTGGQHGTVDSWTFGSVPAGRWQLSVTLPATHVGTLTAMSGPAMACSAGSSTTPVHCTSTLTVGAVDVTANYGLDEYQVGLAVVSKRLAGDLNATPPSTVAMTVGDGSRTVYANDTFAVDGGSPTATFWGAAGSTYTATVASAGLPPSWQPQPQTYSAATPNAALALTEVGTTVQIVVGNRPPFSGTATLTLTAPNGGGYSQTAAVTSGGTATFSGVPLAAGNYTATLSGSFAVAGVTKNLGGSVPVAVTSARPVTATLVPITS